MKELESKLHTDCLTVTGGTVADNLRGVYTINSDVIASLDRPLAEQGGIAVLRGNLSP
ncbi:MAG: dihydroxy-acid dehydratase, partial [Paenibacillus sp.]|nr:dihydroxy-acid dehydratase [Paenibacillus sp.]